MAYSNEDGHLLTASPLSSGTDDIHFFRYPTGRKNLLEQLKSLPESRIIHYDDLLVRQVHPKSEVTQVYAELPGNPDDLAYFAEYREIHLKTRDLPVSYHVPSDSVKFPMKVKVNTRVFKNSEYESGRPSRSGIAAHLFFDQGFPLLSDDSFSESGRYFMNVQVSRHIRSGKLVCGIETLDSDTNTITIKRMAPLADMVMSEFWSRVDLSAAANFRFLFLDEPISKRVFPTQILFDNL